MTDETYATPSSPFFLIIVSPDSFNDFMEQLNIDLPMIGDLHTYLPTNESCSDEEKSKPQVSFPLCCANVSQLQFSKALILFCFIFSPKPCIYEERNAINCLLMWFNHRCPSSFFSSHLIGFVSMHCLLQWYGFCCLSLPYSFILWFIPRIYSFCIAMLCFTFLLSLACLHASFLLLVIQPFFIQSRACAVYFVCLTGNGNLFTTHSPDSCFYYYHYYYYLNELN